MARPLTFRVPSSRKFAFRPSREALREFKDLSAEAKLEWLENGLRFVEAFVSPAKRARWDRLCGRDAYPALRDERLNRGAVEGGEKPE